MSITRGVPGSPAGSAAGSASARIDHAVPDLLGAIVAATRRIVEGRAAVRSIGDLESAAASAPTPRGFRAALAGHGNFAVIAECKRRSPSRGILGPQSASKMVSDTIYDPAAIASSYERHGAAAISVLTEPTFFDGSLDHLARVRQAVQVPLLRKDFIVERYQLLEARLAGADAVLLIVAALDDETLPRLLAEARTLGLDALVEVHDEDELDRAISAGADTIGVNNRNLRTLKVDVATSHRLAARMPEHVLAVAESGLRSGGDLRTLRDAGYRAFLVGEGFMTAQDPGAALGALLASVPAGSPQA
jgi:indole-3-glycerol phosphate synthase